MNKYKLNSPINLVAGLVLLLFCLTNINALAQKQRERDKSAASVGAPSQNAAAAAEQDAKEKYAKEKMKSIDESDVSAEEKVKLKKDLLKSLGLLDGIYYANINFQPRYFSTTILDKWKNIVKIKFPNALNNIVVINQAFSIDYNNYFDREIDKQLTKLIDENPVSEDLAYKYILPDINFIKNNNSELKNDDLFKMIQLYFSSKPGLYNILPSSLANEINNKDFIDKINMSQKR
jgi:hypothetical protein